MLFQPWMTIAEVLALDPRTAPVFCRHGMACVGCAIAPFETLAGAAATYAISIEELLADLASIETAGGSR